MASDSKPPFPSWADLVALSVLLALVVAFFWKMVFTDLILPRGDVFTYFYPYWTYRNAALRTGRIPLWSPELFMGAPFLANSQAGVLYPPNWLLIGLDAPAAVKVAIVTHVAWAAIGIYFLARRTFSLSVPAGVLSGAVFGLGGYLSAQIEHVNQLQGLAWLPWLFWLWSEAVAGRGKAVLWLGLALAMQLLAGHTQSTFISGVGLGAWAAWTTIGLTRELIRNRVRDEAKTNPASQRELIWPLIGLILAALVALGLAAAQLLPTLELTRLSNRGEGLSLREALSFSLRPQIVGRSLLPGYAEDSLFSEYVAYAGVVALLLAVLGGWHNRRDWKLLGLSMLAGLGMFLALGAYNPIYWGLVRFVPGFNLFRVPARWLALWAFAATLLAGCGLDVVTDAKQPRRIAEVLWPVGVIVALVGLAFLAPTQADEVPGAIRPTLMEVLLWISASLIFVMIIGWGRFIGKGASTLLVVVVVAELFLAGQSLPYNRLSAPAAWSSQRPAISVLLAASRDQVPPSRFLSLSDILFDPGDLREIKAIYGPRLDERALYDYLIAVKMKEIVVPNLPLAWGLPSMDGFDGGILPTRDYIRFTTLFLGDQAVDGRLREYLDRVPDLAWLSVANVSWVITDKVYDAWVDGIYYDLQFPARAGFGSGGASLIEAYPSDLFEANAVGIVGHLERAADLQDGALIGMVRIISSEGDLLTLPLLVGEHMADGQAKVTRHGRPEVIGYFTPGETNTAEYLARLSWGTAVPVERIEIVVGAGFSGELVVRGVTLIDDRSGAFQPTSVTPDGVIRLIHSGDVKIYAYEGSLPRAYLVCDPRVVTDQEEAWTQLAQSPLTPVITVGGLLPHVPASCDPVHPGEAIITAYEPERVIIETDSRGDGVYLILSDAWYPDWRATIDGQPVAGYRANGLFRAVAVPPGQHVVVWSYRSRPFEIGAMVSLLCLLGVSVGLVWPTSKPS